VRIRWTARADADLHRIWNFVADRDVFRADRIEAEIKLRTEQLAVFSKLGRTTRMPGVRKLSLTNIQYVVSYEIDDAEIRIIRVRHTKQETP
jgi:plasmid stabilization system protein ParE